MFALYDETIAQAGQFEKKINVSNRVSQWQRDFLYICFGYHQIPGTGKINDFLSKKLSSLDAAASKTSTWNMH
jgi:hypothetical protein